MMRECYLCSRDDLCSRDGANLPFLAPLVPGPKVRQSAVLHRNAPEMRQGMFRSFIPLCEFPLASVRRQTFATFRAAPIRVFQEFDGTSVEDKLMEVVEQQKKALEELKTHAELTAKELAKLAKMPSLCGWVEKEGSGRGVFGRKNWMRRWLLIKDGILTCEPDSNCQPVPRSHQG